MSRKGAALPKPPSRHTLDDHRFGALVDHAHHGDEDQDHDHDEDPRHELVEATSRELESAPFVSIGVDVGSATTQIAFSRLEMHGPGEPSSLRRLLKSRETLWTSPVALTPWRGRDVDVRKIRELVDAAFEAAGLHPDDIDTGALLLTGDAAASSNIGHLIEFLAEDIGDLVSAAAGHGMEALLAAWGSGAVRRSLETGTDLVLVDIGGGTTKFASVSDGRATRVAALRIGSRLATFDTTGEILRLEPEAREFARLAGLDWTPGAHATAAEIELVGSTLAVLVEKALREPQAKEIANLWLTEPFPAVSPTRAIMFSGGVAEYAYGRETRDFGDLGAALGRGLRAAFCSARALWTLAPAGEGIRATVLGAAEHTLQISGETSFVSAPARLLPKRSLPVAAPDFSFRTDIDPDELSAAIAAKCRMMDFVDVGTDFALALRWRGDPDHLRLLACARGIAAGLADRIRAKKPLYLLLEGDCALNLAGALREIGVATDLLALDGVVLRDFDWVDIGRLRLPSNTVPVTLKTLGLGDRRKPD
jgi:ethanolamine utilization protein EutA